MKRSPLKNKKPTGYRFIKQAVQGIILVRLFFCVEGNEIFSLMVRERVALAYLPA
ncbi:hypothetical protein J2Z69_000079 [Paenibacillus shirakamiensis]|uniref:Uncharacterized protein n=1 Tax=Paenibacillus shirakamiensis TaxID=1265935 RepID=A0ABS4JDA4_9BACL|nr:hypothetical protein [Paenibacillus shirakamiensis]